MKTVAGFFLLLVGCFSAHTPSPLASAARNGDVTAIRQLTAHGADPNEASGENGWTPLMHAIHKNQLASVKALLESGASPNVAASGGMTPLMMASGYGYSDIVRALLARGADSHAADEHHERAIDYALDGMTDIDRFTFFTCQDDAVRALAAGGGAHDAASGAKKWARMKRCEAAALVR